MSRKFSPPHSFRCDKETQKVLEILLQSTGYSKSKLVRESLRNYYDSLYGNG